MIFFGIICLLLRNLSPNTEYAAPVWHLSLKTQTQQIEKTHRTVARWSCRQWWNTNSFGDMFTKLEWQTLESRREQSSLSFYYKILSDTVSVVKEIYLTPAPRLRQTRTSQNHWTVLHAPRIQWCLEEFTLRPRPHPRIIPYRKILISSVLSDVKVFI